MTNELDAVLDIIPIDDGSRGPMVVEFVGDVLDTIADRDEKYDRAIIRIVFENLDKVIAAPGQIFEFPVFDITIGVPRINQYGSASRSTAYAILVLSAQKVIEGFKSFRELKGKRVKMGYTDGHKLYNKEKGEYLGKAWEVLEVFGGRNGATQATGVRGEVELKEAALQLLNGKTRQKWQIEVFKNNDIKTVLMTVILNNKLIKEWEDAGLVVKDENGVYTRTNLPF